MADTLEGNFVGAWDRRNTYADGILYIAGKEIPCRVHMDGRVEMNIPRGPCGFAHHAADCTCQGEGGGR